MFRISHGVIILAHSRPGDASMEYLGEQRAPVRIERHAAVYAEAILMPGVTAGECAIVRKGAVVTENVPACTVVAGSPARVIEELPPDKAKLGDGDPRRSDQDEAALPSDGWQPGLERAEATTEAPNFQGGSAGPVLITQFNYRAR